MPIITRRCSGYSIYSISAGKTTVFTLDKLDNPWTD